MDLSKEIKKMESLYLEPPHRVFTMYLNTDPSHENNPRGEWRIKFKNAMKNFDNYLKEDNNSDEKRNFWNVKEKVEKFIQDEQMNFQKSVVIIAASDDSVWFAETFQMPVETHVYWQETAVLDQLMDMQEQFPKTGIVLTQQEMIKCIDASLGQVNDVKEFELDLNTEDWRLHQGGHHAHATMGGGSTKLKSAQRDEFKERFNANRERWYKRIAPKIDKIAKENDWTRIYLVGASDETDILKSSMNKSVEAVINKNMLNKEESKVIEEVIEV